MSDFNLKLYKTTDDYKANKAKLRYFFEYLELQFYTTEHFDGRFFECLDVEELLNSLDYYIDETLPAGKNINTPTKTTPNKNLVIAPINNFIVIVFLRQAFIITLPVMMFAIYFFINWNLLIIFIFFAFN